MAWTIEYLQSVRKSVRKLEPQSRERIRDYIENRLAVLEDPRQLGKPLKAKFSKLWRYRVGDHRIICEIKDDRLIILVVRIGHRREVYD